MNLNQYLELEAEVIALTDRLKKAIRDFDPKSDDNRRDHYGTLYANLLVLEKQIKSFTWVLEKQFNFD